MSFLDKNIISFSPKVFGLDLSDLSIKVFQLEREGKEDKIRSFASVELPLGNIDDGKIINKDKVVEAVKEAVKKAVPKKINTTKVICSIPESKAFLRIINIPKMGEGEAGEAIKWEMEANIPLPIEEVYFDWQFLKSDPSAEKQSVLTVAVSKGIVDDLVEVLEKAGLDVYGLELESVATVRSLMEESGTESALIVDIGAQRTSLIITEGEVPYFTSSIAFSSENLSDAIAKDLKLERKEAENAKINYGIHNFNDGNPVFDSIESLLENLIMEISRTIDFYNEVSKKSTGIEKIILCGGGANMKGLVPYLAKRLDKEIYMGNPWTNLNFGNNLPIVNKADSVRYSTAVGLALRGLHYD